MLLLRRVWEVADWFLHFAVVSLFVSLDAFTCAETICELNFMESETNVATDNILMGRQQRRSADSL